MTCHRPAARLALAAALATFALGAQSEEKPGAVNRTAAEAAFAKADANADGKLSKDEAARLPAIAAKFDDLDKNKDGFLSLDEFMTGFGMAP